MQKTIQHKAVSQRTVHVEPSRVVCCQSSFDNEPSLPWYVPQSINLRMANSLAKSTGYCLFRAYCGKWCEDPSHGNHPYSIVDMISYLDRSTNYEMGKGWKMALCVKNWQSIHDTQNLIIKLYVLMADSVQNTIPNSVYFSCRLLIQGIGAL